jgi:hypothetical protein
MVTMGFLHLTVGLYIPNVHDVLTTDS